ncbi:MAG: hypothetical protein GXO92_05630 [FCB group bacterium]|nr:hypothetical protein [FCB group bacterium]
MTKKPNIIIAGGGTGGHLFPALAIGAQLIRKRPEAQVFYIGSKFGIEARILPKKGLAHALLPIRGLQRGLSAQALARNLALPFRLLRSYYLAKKIFNTINPQVIVGTGGYASAIPLKLAVKSNIPILIQEQNSYPGLTTRMFADKARRVCIAFSDACKYLKKKTLFSQEIQSDRKSGMVTA